MKKSPTPPCLTHVQAADGDAVSAELHVLVMPSIDGGFIAQGIEIDYVASGETEEEVRNRFADGFCRTIMSYLERKRDLAGLFKTATPAEYRQAYFAQATGPILRCAVGRLSDQELPESAPVPKYLNFVRTNHAYAA